jgi:IS1 family transposase
LIPAFFVGKRTGESTREFIGDLASRLTNRVQISTDGLRSYVEAIGDSFGRTGVDYAQLHKTYEAEASGPGRYSPPKVTSTEKTPVYGSPVTELVSTSYVERSNLSVRMGIRRYTRLTNGYSKKLEMHIAATALFVAHYNYTRRHATLRVTPCMEAGLEQTMWTIGDLLDATIGSEP